MKYILALAWSSLFFYNSSAQKVSHQAYTTYYNASLMEPDSVAWNLTPAMVSCTHPPRVDQFDVDPQLPGSAKPSDYGRTGWQQGHLFNWDDACCNPQNITECFYMSNMLPQAGSFNTGDWKTLENHERTWAKSGTIRIVAGGLGSSGKLPHGENIPAFFWKAIYKNGQWTGWVMPNNATSHGHKYNYWMYPNWELFMHHTHFKPGNV